MCILALIPPGTADPYRTVLYTDDLKEDFDISGWAVGSETSETEIGVSMRVDLELINDNYNRTTVEDFKIFVDGPNGTVAVKELDTWNLELESPKTRYVSISAEARPADADEIRFRANHTATLRDGELVDRSVKGRIDLYFSEINETIVSFSTNMSEVQRGSKLYVEGEARRINRVNLTGEWVAVDVNGSFSDWVTVPEDVETGPETLEIVVRTGRGNVFVEPVEVNILNSPPTLEVAYPEEVETGSDLRVDVTAEDDSEVVQTKLVFGEAEIINESGVFYLPVKDLVEGTYSFEAVVRDDEGAEAVSTHNFSIKDAVETGETGEQAGEEGGDDEMPDSIPIFRSIRNFISGLILKIGAILTG